MNTRPHLSYLLVTWAFVCCHGKTRRASSLLPFSPVPATAPTAALKPMQPTLYDFSSNSMDHNPRGALSSASSSSFSASSSYSLLVSPSSGQRHLQSTVFCGMQVPYMSVMKGDTCGPTSQPTKSPTPRPTPAPSTRLPTGFPTSNPTDSPRPTVSPTDTMAPTNGPTAVPSPFPTPAPSSKPTTAIPTVSPTRSPQPTTAAPIGTPSSSPSASPTTSPSAFPTVSPTAAPSATPTTAPSATPTATPSATPSAAPTATPTVAPTVSPTSAPTHTPTVWTQRPTLFPTTLMPTVSMQPSESPTVSLAPTLDPFGVNVEISLNNDDNRSILVTCRPTIPPNAESITAQIIEYEYVLNVQNGTSVPIVLAQVEEDISNHLIQTFMDCRFGLIRDFYVYQMDSAPNDYLVGGCLLEEQVTGATCYTIEGQLLVNFFYIPQFTNSTTRKTRQLQQQEEESQIADENVADAFADALEDILNSPGLGGNSVVSTSFNGITNKVPPPPPEPKSRTPQIVGGVFGAIAGAVLIGFVSVYFLKRHNEEAANQYYQEAMDAVDGEIDDMVTLPAELQPRTATIVNDDDDGEDDNGEANNALESSVGIYSVAANDDAENRAVEFIGTTQSGQHSSFDRERMMKETKEELGPTAYEPQITRGYGVSDTVDL